MNDVEILSTITLTRINTFHLTSLLELYRKLGSATAILEHRNNIRDVVPDASDRLVGSLKNIDDAWQRAEAELRYDRSHGIEPLVMGDPRYPQRLKECDDAPLLLYYKGSTDLNAKRIICIVGTRKCTVYGQDMIRRFVADLRRLCPDVLIVSGLAYGVDIHAHRNALQQGLDTVGVLAHGLDYLYPQSHRADAEAMVRQGGLLTEFPVNTPADKKNFVRRNRIVAGMSDACILVESAAKGGGLITCDIARSYDRDVFAFPGRVGDEMSEGCNNIIRDNVAGLISSATDFVSAMGWQTDEQLQQARQQGIEREIFPDLTDEERTVVEELRKDNDQQINMLTVRTDIAIGRLTAVLFSLEMKGVVKTLAGGAYHLIN